MNFLISLVIKLDNVRKVTYPLRLEYNFTLNVYQVDCAFRLSRGESDFRNEMNCTRCLRASVPWIKNPSWLSPSSKPSQVSTTSTLFKRRVRCAKKNSWKFNYFYWTCKTKLRRKFYSTIWRDFSSRFFALLYTFIHKLVWSLSFIFIVHVTFCRVITTSV